MKKGIGKLACCLLLMTMICGAAWVKDFGKMTNQELVALREAIQNAPPAEQDVYNKEWVKRLAAMTDREKKLYDQPLDTVPAAGEKQKMPYFLLGHGYEDSQGKEIDIYSTGDVTAPGKTEEPGK